MAERLGLGLIPGAGWRAAEIRAVAREAEGAGFDAIFTAEVNSDALATAQLMAEANRQIKVGTWIASIHMRHSYACAKAASLISDATGGRMILGLGSAISASTQPSAPKCRRRFRRCTAIQPKLPAGCAAKGRQPTCRRRLLRCRCQSIWRQ